MLDVMNVEGQSPLSPDEAGAFVAQWAEHNKVGVSELATRLGISDEQTASLMRQARGRISMGYWLADKSSRTSGKSAPWKVMLPIFAVGCALGAFVTSYLAPGGATASFSESSTPPKYQVSFSDPGTLSSGSSASEQGGEGNGTVVKHLPVPNPTSAALAPKADGGQ